MAPGVEVGINITQHAFLISFIFPNKTSVSINVSVSNVFITNFITIISGLGMKRNTQTDKSNFHSYV
jgi:predicted Kef-type K+ transport protein